MPTQTLISINRQAQIMGPASLISGWLLSAYLWSKIAYTKFSERPQ